jgi:nitrite reductase/ring-hydroxylating ferredoxin subunit/uncharacterized membrane protein
MAVAGGRIAQIVDNQIEQQESWLDPLAERLQQLVSQAIQQGGSTGQNLKDFLNGTWLGHPLHPVLTDVAIGGWVTGAVLDLVGIEDGADAAFGLGVAAALPTALSGLADWLDQSDQPRRMGVVHAAFNSTALSLFVGSLLARRSGDRAKGIGLSTAGLVLATGGAFLGGELAYTLGAQINRNAWDPALKDWQVVARAADLLEGQPTAGEAEVGGNKVAIVLLKKGGRIYAMNGTCSHMGGPLAEGKVVDEYCIQCPWHGSVFDVRDGHVTHGPAAYPQATFEAREYNGMIEVRQTA